MKMYILCAEIFVAHENIVLILNVSIVPNNRIFPTTCLFYIPSQYRSLTNEWQILRASSIKSLALAHRDIPVRRERRRTRTLSFAATAIDSFD